MTADAMKDGLYFLSEEEYNAVPRLRFSLLKEIERAPAMLEFRRTHPREETPALTHGIVSDMMLFTPDRVPARVSVWGGGRKQGKEWEAFKASAADRIIISTDERDECEALVNAVRAHKLVAPYLGRGVAQACILWTTHNGIKFKSRLDVLGDDFILDLKTARDASPGAFARQSEDLGYWTQMACYREAVRTLDDAPRECLIVAAEKCAPYLVAPYRLEEKDLEAGRVRFFNQLSMYSLCESGGFFPGFALDSIPTLSRPKWAAVPELEEA